MKKFYVASLIVFLLAGCSDSATLPESPLPPEQSTPAAQTESKDALTTENLTPTMQEIDELESLEKP